MALLGACAPNLGAQSSMDGQQYRGTWQYCIHTWLGSAGWLAREPGKWEHAEWNHAQAAWPAMQHHFREAWRRKLFQKFCASQRRDARLMRWHNVPYRETATKPARKEEYEKGNSHTRAVLSGAALSDAVAQIAAGSAPKVHCEWCGSQQVPTWTHLAWKCEAFAVGRPPEPVDALQHRLGLQRSSLGPPHECEAARPRRAS